ncbi:hypothetical protein TWF481_004984 [Arthrobotrys musiformis]|uniref:FAD-binding PCMH-type domain-containing protein n=1 Tax=Arthrobotrys musiformis TaxID=47236 RepID=A0AAV9WL47_9PEZI
METIQEYSTDLVPRLSSHARIVGRDGRVERYDESSAPNPAVTVFPHNEDDVAEIVRYCRERGLKCFAQSGGHGCRIKNHNSIDVVICMRPLNQVSVDESQHTVTIGGGTVVGELIDGVAEKGFEVATGLVNSVGAVGSLLLGGLGRYVGKYGMGIDNLVAINFVDAHGTIYRNVDGVTHPDLWWAMRGAGSAFGIVTQATLRIYPHSNNGLSWTCTLIFTNPSKETIERTFRAIDTTEFEGNMCILFFFAFLPPTGHPSLVVALWFSGSESEAEKAWERVLDPSLEPDFKKYDLLPTNRLNDANEAGCIMGMRRPSLGMGIERLDVAAFHEIWDLWLEFGGNEDAEGSAIFIERFSKKKSLEVSDDATAFSRFHRGIMYEVTCSPAYKDSALDHKVGEFTANVRDILVQKCGDPGKVRTYPAGAGSNEPLENIFGEKERVQKLLSIKKKWDPENYWNAFLGL